MEPAILDLPGCPEIDQTGGPEEENEGGKPIGIEKETGETEEKVKQALVACYNAPLKAKEYLQNRGAEKELNFYQLCDQLLMNLITPQELIDNSEINIPTGKISRTVIPIFTMGFSYIFIPEFSSAIC